MLLISLFAIGIILFITGFVLVMNDRNIGWIISVVSLCLIFGSLFCRWRVIQETGVNIYEENGELVWSAEIGELRCHYNEKDYLVCEV